jgi:CRP-like cAMP-binding protein
LFFNLQRPNSAKQENYRRVMAITSPDREFRQYRFQNRFRARCRESVMGFFSPVQMPNLFSMLDAHAMPSQVQAGTTLFRGGDAVRAVYMIRRGRVAFTWSTKAGVTSLDTLGSGAIVGLPAVLNGEYSVSARAVEDCELGCIPAEKVRELLATDHTMLREVTKLLAADVARMRELARTRSVEAS